MSSFKYQAPSIILIPNIVAVSCFDILGTIDDCDLVQAYLNFKTDLSLRPSPPLHPVGFQGLLGVYLTMDKN